MQATMTVSNHSGGAGKLFVFALVLVAAIAALIATSQAGSLEAAVDTSPATEEERAFGWSLISAVPPIEKTSDHAEKHKEAQLVRQTCRQNGVYQVWREIHDKSTFHLLCMTFDGKLVDWIITVTGGRFIEKTAFAPRAGVPAEVLKYVASKATRFTKGW